MDIFVDLCNAKDPRKQINFKNINYIKKTSVTYSKDMYGI